MPQGDGIGVSEPVGSVIATHKHIINQFYICQIVSALDILVDETEVTATLLIVYVSIWGD